MSLLGLSRDDLDGVQDDIDSTEPFSNRSYYPRIRSESNYCFKALIASTIGVFFILLVFIAVLLHRHITTLDQLETFTNHQFGSVTIASGIKTNLPIVTINTGTLENPNLIPASIRPPQMLVVCSHHGTRADMYALASHFQFDVDWFNLEIWTTGDFRHHHDRLYDSHVISALCHVYDIIAVTDNIWGAWLFLKLKQEEQCVKKLLLVATNRYDNYLMVDKEHNIDLPREWHDLLSQSLRDNNWRYPVMVQNNPFEIYYMKHNGLDLSPTPENRAAIPPPPKDLIPVIRSLGASPIPFDPTATREANPHRCIYFINSWHQAAGQNTEKLAQKQGLKARCHLLSTTYGGPTYFYQQNTAFWFMPYQVSLMKQSELVIAGVITLIPSMKFWIEIESLINDYRYVTYAINTLTNEEHMTPAQIAEVIDTWSSAYAPCTVEFNSWQELDYLIDTQSWRSKLPECHEYRKYYQNAQLGLWHQLFNDRFPHIPRAHVTPAVREAVKKLYQVDL